MLKARPNQPNVAAAQCRWLGPTSLKMAYSMQKVEHNLTEATAASYGWLDN